MWDMIVQRDSLLSIPMNIKCFLNFGKMFSLDVTNELFKLLSLNPLLRSYFGDLKIIRKVAQDNKFMTHFIRAIIWKPSYMQTMLEPNRLYLLPQQQKTSKPDKSEQPHFHHAINKSYNFKQCK